MFVWLPPEVPGPDEARAAAAEFMTSGQRPDCVGWADALETCADAVPGNEIRAGRANIGTLGVDIGSVGGDLHGASAGDHGGTEVAGTEHVARHDGT
jgi:hypothetical protein